MRQFQSPPSSDDLRGRGSLRNYTANQLRWLRIQRWSGWKFMAVLAGWALVAGIMLISVLYSLSH